ncbi:hypothetical protein [Flammeovirga kamogawensis]|uniref:TonB C-terminal domain-containing protein n=1 Tax=Flammeovirga kamogawensis TaxID=373891 RepID=A0ABX8H2K3_9BACT|nr:hypothetical protein [Flammeovirga kamogawensis]MBB6464129.1 hypothetical protein [Flammeovirga kamogawensis]QWG09933.1 hypothetical protein KM029_19825 [Flammeovirga kamogawensis]TRX65442.1 hypothetical protein EO216_23250 [Flammeovirga kamogawensis]
MRLISVFLFIIPSLVLSQTINSSCESRVDTLTNSTYYLDVDNPAKIIDGKNSLFKEISKKIIINQESKRLVLDGVKLIITYLITEKGEVTGVRYMRGEEQL